MLCMGCWITTTHGAVSNPFEVTGTDIEKGAEEFTVYIHLKESINLAAFEISVDYDDSVLEVANQEGTGYGYTDEFKSYYTNGYAVCNDKGNTEVVFAGAKNGAGSFRGNVAKVTFKVKSQTQSATTLKLHVVTAAGENTTGIVKLDISNPEIAYLLMLKEFDKLYGDVNFNGSIGLDDARMALKAALKIDILDGESVVAADVNQDGSIQLSDAQTILKKALRIIP